MSEDIVERMRFWSKTRNNNPTAWNLDCAAAADAIERLTAERDEARRIACAYVSGIYRKNMITLDRAACLAEAERRGWDCFKEDGK